MRRVQLCNTYLLLTIDDLNDINGVGKVTWEPVPEDIARQLVGSCDDATTGNHFKSKSFVTLAQSSPVQ